MSSHSTYMATWYEQNPEYEYAFFSDDAASRFVNKHASAAEREAYHAVVTGAQKADLFRLVALRYRGGVYADADMELRRPLRRFIPSNASAVVGGYWGSEFLAFEPNHPLLVHATARIAANVHRQLKWMREGNSSKHCGSAHSCVILVSGPYALRAALSKAAKSMGCKLPGRIGSAAATIPACPEAVQRTHACTKDRGNVYRTWACDAAFHWDCRNSGAKRKCASTHYSRHRRGPGAAKAFFNLTAGGGGGGAAAHDGASARAQLHTSRRIR